MCESMPDVFLGMVIKNGKGTMMRETVLSRTAFVAAAGTALLTLVGCGGQRTQDATGFNDDRPVKDKMDATIELMQSYVETIGASSVVFDDDVAKVSIVGAGMESHPGVASDMFEALFEANVNIQMISTSEIKISVLIKKEDANKAVAAIHAKFFEQIGQ